MVQLLQYSFKLQYMTGAGTGTGAAIMDNSGTGAGVRICRKKILAPQHCFNGSHNRIFRSRDPDILPDPDPKP